MRLRALRLVQTSAIAPHLTARLNCCLPAPLRNFACCCCLKTTIIPVYFVSPLLPRQQTLVFLSVVSLCQSFGPLPPSSAPSTLQHKRFLNPIGTLFLFSQIAPAAYVLLPAATRFASTIANRRSSTREKGNCKDPIFLLPPGHIFLIEVLHHHIHANSIVWLARFSQQNHSFHVRRPLGDIHDNTTDRYSYHRRQTHALTGSAEHWETSTPASVSGNKIDSPRSVISPPPTSSRPHIHVGFPLSSFHFPIFYFSLFSLDLSPRNGVHIFSAATKYSLPSHSYRLRLFT